MADVVVRSTQPALAAVKLAWWRERLEELDQGKVPAEPRLQDAARELLPRGVSGAQLAEIEAGWAALLQEAPDPGLVVDRGATLFRLAAALLEVEPAPTLSRAGQLFAAADVRRRGLGHFPAPGTVDLRVVRPARPLTSLAALAARDLRRSEGLEPEATPGRAWTLLKHWLTGRI